MKVMLCVKKILKGALRWGIEIIYWGFIVVTGYVVMQVFLLTSFRIPSDSMSPGVIAGDCALVWKPTVGARLFNLFKAVGGEKTPIWRTPGLRRIRRNDVLVFNYPYPQTGEKIEMHLLLYYIKRCVALPGDTFRIDNGFYRVSGVADTLGLHYRQAELSARPDSSFSEVIFRCFPFDSTHGWTVKHFGPLYVPRRGDRVAIDAQNIALYRTLIAWETDKTVDTDADGQPRLDGRPLYAYTFTKNYYFMAGDYVLDSKDSRYWGLLPEDLIVGRATLIWKSVDPKTGKFRREHFLKQIR